MFMEFWLHSGWTAFARANRLIIRSTVSFKYIGESRFQVIAFHLTYQPKLDLYIHSSQLFEMTITKNFADQSKFADKFPNTVKLEADDGKVWTVKLEYKDGKLWFIHGWERFSKNYSFNIDDFVIFKYDGTCKLFVTLIKAEQTFNNHPRTKIHDEDVMVDLLQKTLWTNKISSAMESGNQALVIPTAVVHRRLRNKPSTLKIILPWGELCHWSFIWNKSRPNQCQIGKGWYDFVKAYPIRCGDDVRFYLLPDDEDIMRLEVIKFGL